MYNSHFVVEHLGLSGLGLGDQRLIEDVQDITAHGLQLILDLLAILADLGDVLLVVFRLLLLLDAGDDAPRSTSGSDNVLVGDRQQVALVYGELSAKLSQKKSQRFYSFIL